MKDMSHLYPPAVLEWAKKELKEQYTLNMAKHHGLRQEIIAKVQSRIDKKIDEAIEKLMSEGQLERLIDRAVNKLLTNHYNITAYPFKGELDRKLREAASKIKFTASIEE